MSLFKKSLNVYKENDNKPTRYYSNKQEKEVAKRVGGKQTANSGATPFQKSDVSTEKWNIECKTKIKDAESFSIKKEWLDKNKEEMVFMGKDYSALVFNFGPDKPNYYIIDEPTFLEFLAYQRGEI